MNKQLKKTIGAGLAVLALLVAGGGYYYFHVHTDTPNFTIKEVREAINRHNLKDFHHAVNVDSLLDSGYDGFVEGMTSPDRVTTLEAQEVIRDFTKMLRGPMIASLKAAIDSYVATGEINPTQNAGVLEMLERVGLNGVEVRTVNNFQLNDANRNEAFADVIIFQPELGSEFPLQIALARGTDNQWQVVRVLNFKDYVAQILQVRRAQLDDYLTKSGEINARHESVIRDFGQLYADTLAKGSLGQDNTRNQLKNLINDVFLKDWEARKQELFGLHVPKEAETLHNLYLRICDTWIDAAHDYAKWMDDKNVDTIKSAEDKIHQAQTLTTDAANLAKNMTS